LKKTLIILAATLTVLSVMWSSKLIPEKAISVEAIRVERSDILKSITSSGVLKEIRSKKLYPEKNAVIEKIYVNNGDTVTEDQVLMLLRSIKDASAYAGTLDEVDTALSNYGIDIKQIAPESFDNYLNGDAEDVYFLIKSPFCGIVTDLSVSEGESVSSLTACAEVSDMSRIQAIVKIREADITQISAGMPVMVSGESLKSSYSGVVLNISPRISEVSSLLGGSGTYGQAVVELYAPDKNMFLGGTITAKIFVARKINSIFLPYEAVDQNSDNKEICYVVSNGRAELREIVTGEDYSQTVEVLDGLQNGELVITSAAEDLYNGAPVNIVEGKKSDENG